MVAIGARRVANVLGRQSLLDSAVSHARSPRARRTLSPRDRAGVERVGDDRNAPPGRAPAPASKTLRVSDHLVASRATSRGQAPGPERRSRRVIAASSSLLLLRPRLPSYDAAESSDCDTTRGAVVCIRTLTDCPAGHGPGGEPVTRRWVDYRPYPEATSAMRRRTCESARGMFVAHHPHQQYGGDAFG